MNLVLRVFALGLCASSLGSCIKHAAPERSRQAVRVSVVERQARSTSLRYSAHVEPASKVDLAFRVGGYVDSIAKGVGVDGKPRVLQEGDSVAQGQELAALRRAEYGQKLAEAQAARDQAKATADQAQIDYNRAAALLEKQSATQADVDTLRSRLNTAQAGLAAAVTRVDQAATALSDTSLRSPLAGTVMRRSIEVGSLAGPGTVGFTIADLSAVKVVFGVPDTVLPRVHLGASQALTTESLPDVSFVGRISRISPSADPRSRIFEAEILVDNADGRLKAGMIAALSLEASPASGAAGVGAEAERPLIPLSAVVRSKSNPKGFAVFILEPGPAGEVVHARDVELGEYLGRVIPVKKGLEGGERIAVSGAGLLSDGEEIEVLP